LKPALLHAAQVALQLGINPEVALAAFEHALLDAAPPSPKETP
jgi:hypothetical protein